MVRMISISRLVLGGIGIWLGFYFLFGGQTKTALDLIALLMVAVTGIISFVSHFILYKEDAAHLGWSSEKPFFQWEVGFANLAFGLIALFAYLANWGIQAEACAVLGYGLYLLQSSLLHVWRSAVEKRIPSGYFYRSAVGGMLYSVCLVIFGVIGVMAK